MAETLEFLGSVANTSRRKLLAFPLKSYPCPEADPRKISKANRLVFHHVYLVVK
jgi:hypothetical protein